MDAMLTYIKKDSPIDKLTGATKLICFIFWTLAAMLTYDTRVLIGMLIFSLIIFTVFKIEFKEVSFIVYFILLFLLLNDLAIFIFSPYEGVNIYGTRYDIFHIIGPYTLTWEQLLSIALRYIPDIQREYHDISFAQQARGIDMSKKEKLGKRIKNMSSILMPLIFSSLDRIENISTAMELRAFGKNKKRTWYNERKFSKGDYLAIIVVILIVALSLYFTFNNGSRFYNPFIK